MWGKIVPVRSIPTGVRIVWFARSVMSKPFSASEALTTTATRICEGMLPVKLIMGGATGQVVSVLLAAMQTTPVVAEWTLWIDNGIA